MFDFLDRFLRRTDRILVICALLILYSVVFDGTLFQLRKLYLSKKALSRKTFEIETKNQVIENKIKNLSHPRYLEKEVRNRFDLAGEGDLIFIFPED